MDSAHHRIRQPLWFIAIGYLLIIFDLIIVVDVLNDILGAVLVWVGCVRLAQLHVDARYNRVMTFVKAGMGILVLTALCDMMGSALPAWLTYVRGLGTLVGQLAFVGLGFALVWLAQQLDLPDAVLWWRWTSGAAALSCAAMMLAMVLAASPLMWWFVIGSLALQIVSGFLGVYAILVTRPELSDPARRDMVLATPGTLPPAQLSPE